MFETVMSQKGKAMALFVALAFAVAGLTASPAIAFAAQHENMTMTMDENMTMTMDENMSPMGNMTGGGNATSMTENVTETESMTTTVTSISDPSAVAQGPGNVSDPSVLAQLSGLDRHPHLAPGNVSDSSAVAQGQGNATDLPFVTQNQAYDPNNCFYSNVTMDTCPIHTHFKGLSNATTDCFKIVGEAKVSTGNVQNYTKSVQSFFSLLPANNELTTINVNLAGGSGPLTNMQEVWDLMESEIMTRENRQMVLDEVNGLLASAQPGFTQEQLDALTFCIISEANALGPGVNY